MPVVRMPDGALVNFPDDMPQEEIKGLIASKFPDIATRSAAPERGLLDTFGGGVSRGMSRPGS